MRFQGLVIVASILGGVFAHPQPQLRDAQVGTETPYIRSYFFAGGRYVDDGAGGHIFRDQMYVERLVPASGVTQGTPIVFIHGQAQTGSNFLNKPDGGQGWASQFIRQGYELYIVDQTFRGR
ncbi:hypothetical protein B0T11DRAFT_300365, partial [Plectosphaerella cucumerina]